ncbi:MAG TPA: RNA polymerase sigma-70 factor [Candidatus Saccharimonadales bacterium]|nr:RNA polymerase sigma-70 factor [Candidatus Saccharimonadales bacterium]
MTDAAVGTAYQELRPRLFGIAYRMLSSVSEAEDVVQETFVRYQQALADGITVDSPAAYLSAIITRLSIDQLRSARVRRETYVGEWLPEPIVEEIGRDDPALIAERSESLSISFLLLLERLTPTQRAVFLLHDVFDYDFDEIATVVGKSVSACRQEAVRARRHLEADRPRFDVTLAERDELVAGFFAAAGAGDVDGLIELLAEDVLVHGDGGGKVPQWAGPIVGAERVARLFAGGATQMRSAGVDIELARVNGQPGAIMRGPGGSVVGVLAFEASHGRIHRISSMVNPDKLSHVGRVTDLGSVLRGRAAQG